jgi:site-specific DNA-methyltransferase (adenine-specific)
VTQPIQIVEGDAQNWLQAQTPDSFQCLILDHPYNVGYRYRSFQDEKPRHQYLAEQVLVLSLCQRVLKPGGSLFYLNYPETAADLWGRVDFLDKVDWVSWVYHSHTGGTPLRKASRAWLWFAKGSPLTHAQAFAGEYRNPTDPRVQARMQAGHRPQGYDWMEFEQVKNTSREKRGHPCQVPQAMLERFILATTDPGDLVGDCYSGSGTTALAAQRLGRAFQGCELDAEYVALARAAVAEAGNQAALFQGEGLPGGQDALAAQSSDLSGDQETDLIRSAALVKSTQAEDLNHGRLESGAVPGL